MAEAVYSKYRFVTNQRAASNWLELFQAPLSTSAPLLTASFLCSTWCDCSRGANICSSLLSERHLFFSESNKMYSEINFTSRALLSSFSWAVYAFDIFRTVQPTSVPVEYEWKHFRAFVGIAFSIMAILRKIVWTSRTDGVVMPNGTRAPRRAKLKTVCRNESPIISAKKRYPTRKRVWKISRTRRSFSAYVATVRDTRSTCRTCSVSVPRKFGSGKCATIVSFKCFERALSLVLITVVIFSAGTVFQGMIHFRNCITWSLSILKLARKFVVFIASKEWTSNARFTSELVLGAASTIETGSILVDTEWKDEKKERIRKERQKEHKRKRKLCLETGLRGSKQIEMIESVLRGRCYVVNREKDSSTSTTAMKWGISMYICFCVKSWTHIDQIGFCTKSRLYLMN